MQRLILLRHGKAESTAASGGDFERGLTERGRREAAQMGRVLAEAGSAPDLVLVSTARRAMETWEAVSASFPKARMAPARELYHASSDALADAIDTASQAAASLMIVGHNPGLHELSLALPAKPAEPAPALGESFPTAAAAVFEVCADGRFKLERFLIPRDHGGGPRDARGRRLSALHDVGRPRAVGLLDAETAHRLTIRLLSAGLGPRVAAAPGEAVLAIDLCGLKLDNCLGLAAGFDKNAEVPDAMLAAGFGFVECGAVTPRPQAGNPRPRLFRLAEDHAVINRMGFNNDGLDVVAARLGQRARKGVVGVNLGANKDSEDRAGDYATGLARLWDLADFFVLNVSSPNTPGLRALQGQAALNDLLERISERRAALAAASAARPIFLKIAPDLEETEIAAVVEAAIGHGLDGVIAGNTTLGRPASLASPQRDEAGGLSGAPLRARSTAVLRQAFAAARGRLVLIGVGGVTTGADAYAKIRAGASAVQLYSALVYEGPGLIGRIRRDLAALLAADGYTSVANAVGADHRP